ncbi:hypothetical protein [Dyadobacter sp.]|uniref:hypothetical protein n=1 Tax=Dyadobacter sp. TaxID=1914288 RepID=UPI003267D00E
MRLIRKSIPNCTSLSDKLGDKPPGSAARASALPENHGIRLANRTPNKAKPRSTSSKGNRSYSLCGARIG